MDLISRNIAVVSLEYEHYESKAARVRLQEDWRHVRVLNFALTSPDASNSEGCTFDNINTKLPPAMAVAGWHRLEREDLSLVCTTVLRLSRVSWKPP